MPKMYSDKEKEQITKQLKEAANECLMIYGVKKTTVDELVKRVNIPKGTFYLFYESKELLLFDAIKDLHNELQSQLLKEISSLSGDIGKDQLTDLIFRIIKRIDQTYLLQIMTNGDMELIMRKLPDEIVLEHLKQDDFSMEQFIALIPQARYKNVETFSGALRGIFLTLLYKREIGKEVFEESLRLMIRGIVIQLMED
ncbi:TetR/AcrR family transcriptional regulator [Anaerocolumna sp. AGMB13025]|uniref:TetR/AcrR family transcriptional regulator n=1 Tax=Anaerocolumna sp. AGMB13025 TaxID=3039116 RepID=UPI00241CE548|nr:TetR/AcrR family transcriptional regulator [Anaerocolumna sp. AGMB13025]WFR55440.1 TetR/AcrR family transcriptional regulator [Anaerocolumna sp. AGMB13025]